MVIVFIGRVFKSGCKRIGIYLILLGIVKLLFKVDVLNLDFY